MSAASARMFDDAQRFQVARQLGANFGDRLTPATARRGRGAASNASGRFEPTAREDFDDGWTRDEAPEPLKTEVTWEKPKAIITRSVSLAHLPSMIEELRGPNDETKVQVQL